MPHPSRRDITRALGLATAGAALPLSGCTASPPAGGGAAAPASPAQAPPSPASGGGFFAANRLDIGLQLYTLGPELSAQLPKMLARLSEIGYRAVEIPSYYGRRPAELRREFDAAGLKCPSAHIGLRPGTAEEPGLLGDLDRLADDLAVIGATHAVAPAISPPLDIDLKPAEGEGFRFMGRVAAAMSEDHWRRVADMLNAAAMKLSARGILVGYHNHNFEFTPVKGEGPGGRTGLDVLLAATDASRVAFTLDAGWASAAGRDPAEVLRAAPGRFRLMHVKDVQSTTRPNFALHLDPTEVGSGRIDWPTLLPEAHRLGVRHFFVEQEPPFTMARIDAAAKSFDYLSKV